MSGPPASIAEALRDATKLFIGQIPRQMTEADLRPLFEPYGDIIEVAVIRQRGTGESRGCAFVSFKRRADAEAAMSALHNKINLQGSSNPMQVRYAESGATRPVEQDDVKLFIGKVPNTATEEDLRPVFEPYGRLVEVAVLRGPDGVSKGCAFVRYRTRDEAVAAISALDGKYRMPNGPTELVVRFSESRRDKETRGGGAHQGGGMGGGYIGNQGMGGNAPMQTTMQLLEIQQQIARLQAVQAQIMLTPGGGPAGALRPPPAPVAPYGQIGGYVPPAVRAAVSPTLPIYTGVKPEAPSAIPPPPPPAQMPAGIPAYGMRSGAPPSPLRQTEGPPGANLFIYHLPREFTDMDLGNVFMPFGNMLNARVFIDKETGASKCFGFVSYDNPVSAQRAIDSMNGYAIGDKRLKVQLKHDPSKSSKPY